ncbi:uncharacterized protein PFL1_01716 [Pseudozyma flocculosa PF-1]|nr:uncharacterized protein PFL1_01716 [Pseudozyma flocculosa PF-1]EPQ30817.1 hypothetical protein PFL1_01716 [Pseudozyma flocculosa PF-1]
MGMLTEEGDKSLTHEKLVLSQSSPLEKVQWRAWKEGYRLPPMLWSESSIDREARQQSQAPAHRQIEAAQPADDDFATSCKVEALRELYADELEGRHGTLEGSPTPLPPSASPLISPHPLPPHGRGHAEFAVTAADVRGFEARYPELCPLLRVQAKIVASMSNTVAKEHLGVECELQERRCALHLVRAYEEQLRVALARIQAQVEVVRHNCEVIRSRANAMSAPFDDAFDGHTAPEPVNWSGSEARLRNRTRGEQRASRPAHADEQQPGPRQSLRHATPQREFAGHAQGVATAKEADFAPVGDTKPNATVPVATGSSGIKRFFGDENRASLAKRSRSVADSRAHPHGGGGDMGPPAPPAARVFLRERGAATPAAGSPAFFESVEPVSRASGGGAAAADKDRGTGFESSPRPSSSRARQMEQDDGGVEGRKE